jgi:hypothetical protein
LLGFCFGVGIDTNNVNDLARKFKSPRNQTQLVGAKISQAQEAFAGVDIS